MKYNPLYIRMMTTLLAVATVVALTVIASGAGTTDDPLITLSYLNGTFRDSLVKEVTDTVEDLESDLEKSVNTHGKALESAMNNQDMTIVQSDYTVVSLAPGETVSLEIGTEVLWLSGTATVQNAVLTDTTTGSKLPATGKLTANHLYVSTGNSTITASDGAQCLVK